MQIKRRYFLFLVPLLLLVLASDVPSEIVRVGIYHNPPLSSVNDDGNARGFMVDILNEIAQREKWELKFIFCEWDECLRALENGEIDLLGPIAYSEERTKRFDFSEETLITNWGQVYVQSGETDVSILDLGGKTIAAINGDIHTKYLQNRLSDFDIATEFIFVDDYDSVMQAVENEQAFGGVVNHLYALQHATDYDVVQSAIIFNPIEVRFAAMKGEHIDLLSALDKQMAAMKADKSSIYYQHLNLWFDTSVEYGMPFWAKWAAAWLMLSVTLLALGSLFLRSEVRRRTAALEESEVKYRGLVNNSLVGIQISQNQILQFCNQGFADLYGYESPQEMIGMGVKDLVTSESWDRVKSEINSRESGQKKTSRYRAKGIRRDGEIFDIEILGVAIQYKGKPAVQSVLIDITSRVRAEERFKNLSKASFEAIFISEKGICLEANLAAEKLFGYSLKEFIGMSATDIIALEDRNLVIHHILSGHDEPYSITAQRKDGSTFPAELNGRIMRYEGRAVRVTSLRDISIQARAEKALRESEKKFRDLFEKSEDALLIIENGKFIDCNQATVKMLLYKDKDEFLNSHPSELSPPKQADGRDSVEKANEMIQIAKENGSHRFLWEHLRANGEIFPVEVLLTAILTSNNHQILHTTWRDITERVEAENAIQESEERYRLFFENNDAIILLVNPEIGEIVFANDAATKFYGYKKEEFLGMNIARINVLSPQEIKTKMIKAGKKKQNYFLFKHKLANGKIRDVEIYQTKMLLNNQEIFSIIVHDITERVQAEKALKQHTQELETRNTITTALSASLQLEDLLEIILEELVSIIDFDSAAIFLLEKTQEQVTIAKVVGDNAALTGLSVHLDETFMQSIHTETLILDDLEKSPLFKKWDYSPSTIRGWMGLPLYARDSLVGYLTFDSRQPRAFSPQDASLAESFAPHIAQALYNARLLKEIKENLQQLETLNTITSALSTSLDLDNVLELILDKIGDVLPLDSGTIFLLLEEDTLQVVASRNLSPSVKDLTFAKVDEFFGLIRQSGQPLILNEPKENPLFKNWGEADDIESWLGIPLIVRDRLIGFLTLDSNQINAYSSKEIKLVQPFVDQAAQAIHNARLYQRVIADSNEMEKRVQERTEELQNFVNLTAGREIRMAELKGVISKLRKQLIEAGQVPVADDPLIPNQ